MKGIITAIRTLSCLPVPGKDAQEFSDALIWFPVVGFLLGGIVYSITVLLLYIPGMEWPEGIAVVCIGVNIFLTRGLHLDGIADWADGFWGGHSPEKVLTIMKDTYLGTFGTIVLALTLLSKWIGIVEMIELQRLEWIVAAFVIARAMQVELAVCIPYARKEGTASPFLKNARTSHRIIAHGMALVLLAWLYHIPGVLCFFVCFVLNRGFGSWCLKKAGGITGDLLGAGSELMEIFVLFFAVLIPPELLRYRFHFGELL